MAEKRELTEEELASLAPSDRAHYKAKGQLAEDPADLSESSRVARAAAFEGTTDVDRDEDDSPDTDPEDNDGVLAEGEGPTPQTEDEAKDAEASRRAEMSEVELEEAHRRDEVAGGEAGEMPNLGSKDPEEG